TLWRQELEVFPSLQAMSIPERNALSPLKAELYSPIVAQGRLIGILALGPKQRGQIFSREDLYVLSSITRQAALNLENVRLLKLERERALHLKRLEEMKSDLLLAVSHQLKTPLTSIRVSAGILGDSKGQVSEELRERLVEEITRGVDDLQSLIYAILDFAKMQTATLKLTRQPTDLRVIIREVARLLAPHVRLKEQTLDLSLPDSLPRAMMDGERIRQVLVCLLSNANKFTPKGGRISVSLRKEDSSFFVEVRDTGPGVAPEEHGKIFEAYYQVKGATGKSSSGTGLGLTIAKGLVELHGGRIWVESTPGEGAAFFFSLPVEAEASPEPLAPRPETPVTKPVLKLP
ncbi:MAG: ATP-binding protein, partial [Chloroflexota bacterium]|nr:ATP-binding protein [Chloroflexota bacterium]